MINSHSSSGRDVTAPACAHLITFALFSLMLLGYTRSCLPGYRHLELSMVAGEERESSEKLLGLYNSSHSYMYLIPRLARIYSACRTVKKKEEKRPGARQKSRRGEMKANFQQRGVQSMSQPGPQRWSESGCLFLPFCSFILVIFPFHISYLNKKPARYTHQDDAESFGSRRRRCAKPARQHAVPRTE